MSQMARSVRLKGSRPVQEEPEHIARTATELNYDGLNTLQEPLPGCSLGDTLERAASKASPETPYLDALIAALRLPEANANGGHKQHALPLSTAMQVGTEPNVGRSRTASLSTIIRACVVFNAVTAASASGSKAVAPSSSQPPSDLSETPSGAPRRSSPRNARCTELALFLMVASLVGFTGASFIGPATPLPRAEFYVSVPIPREEPILGPPPAGRGKSAEPALPELSPTTAPEPEPVTLAAPEALQDSASTWAGLGQVVTAAPLPQIEAASPPPPLPVDGSRASTETTSVLSSLAAEPSSLAVVTKDVTQVVSPAATTAARNNVPVPAEGAVTSMAPAPTPSASSQPANSVTASLSMMDRQMLLSRADALLRTGDVISARLFYQRAADAGDSTAALWLGATFDPVFLSRAGLSPVAADLTKALQWYRHARDLGNREADVLLKSIGARYN
jgi:hypothetical protein